MALQGNAASAAPSKILYLSNLPSNSTDSMLLQIFGAYGSIEAFTFLPARPPVQKSASLAQFSSIEEAQWLVDNLGGNIPQGLQEPVAIEFADQRHLLLAVEPADAGQNSAAEQAPPRTEFTGEVRFDAAENAQLALQQLNGSMLGGKQISVTMHHSNNPLGTKLLISGIPAGVDWRKMKDHFATCGQVAFADIHDGSKGKGKGKIEGAPFCQYPYAAAAAGFAQPGMIAMQASPYGQAFAPTGMKMPGEVRFDNPDHAQLAIQQLNGSMLGGAPIAVTLHGMNNPLGTKLMVTSIPDYVDWRQLKEHFSTCGAVAFADIIGGKGKSKGKGSPQFFAGNMMCGGGAPPPMMGMPALGSCMPTTTPGTFPGLPAGSLVGGVVPGGRVGEIRYDDPQHSQLALQTLNGSVLNGQPIGVRLHGLNNPTGTKLLITGIAPDVDWAVLKNYFAVCGTVAYSGIK